MKKFITKFKKGIIFAFASLALAVTAIVVPLSQPKASGSITNSKITIEIYKSDQTAIKKVHRINSTELVENITDLEEGGMYILSLKYSGDTIPFPFFMQTGITAANIEGLTFSTAQFDYRPYSYYIDDTDYEQPIDNSSSEYSFTQDSEGFVFYFLNEYTGNFDNGYDMSQAIGVKEYVSSVKNNGSETTDEEYVDMTVADCLKISDGDYLAWYSFTVDDATNLADISFTIDSEVQDAFFSYFTEIGAGNNINDGDYSATFAASSLPKVEAPSTDVTGEFQYNGSSATSNDILQGGTWDSSKLSFATTSASGVTVKYSTDGINFTSSTIPTSVFNDTSTPGKKVVYAKVYDDANAENVSGVYSFTLNVYPTITLDAHYVYSGSDTVVDDKVFTQVSTVGGTGSLTGSMPTAGNDVSFKLSISGLASNAKYSVGSVNNATAASQTFAADMIPTSISVTADGLTTTYSITITTNEFGTPTISYNGNNVTLTDTAGTIDVLDKNTSATSALVATMAGSDYTITYGTTASNCTASSMFVDASASGVFTRYIKITKGSVSKTYTITINSYPTITLDADYKFGTDTYDMISETFAAVSSAGGSGSLAGTIPTLGTQVSFILNISGLPSAAKYSVGTVSNATAASQTFATANIPNKITVTSGALTTTYNLTITKSAIGVPTVTYNGTNVTINSSTDSGTVNVLDYKITSSTELKATLSGYTISYSTNNSIYTSSLTDTTPSTAGEYTRYVKIEKYNVSRVFTITVKSYPTVTLEGKYVFETDEYAMLSETLTHPSNGGNAGTYKGTMPTAGSAVSFKLGISGLSSGETYSIGSTVTDSTAASQTFASNSTPTSLVVKSSDGKTSTTYNFTITKNEIATPTVKYNNNSVSFSGTTGTVNVLDKNITASSALVATGSGYTFAYSTDGVSYSSSLTDNAAQTAGTYTRYVKVTKNNVYKVFTVTINSYPTLTSVSVASGSTGTPTITHPSTAGGSGSVSITKVFGGTLGTISGTGYQAGYTVTASGTSSITVTQGTLSTTYSISTTEGSASTINTLDSLTVDGSDALSAAATSTGYAITKVEGEAFDIEWVLTDNTATVKIGGVAVTSPYSHTVTAGSTTITLVVHPQSTSGTTKEYKIVVTGLSKDVTVSSVKAGSTTLTATGNVYSKLDFETSVTSTSVTITTTKTNASVIYWPSTGSEATATTGKTISGISLNATDKSIYYFRVISEAGETYKSDVYTIELRQKQATATTLSSVTISNGTKTYTASGNVITVPYEVTTLTGYTLTATAVSTAKTVQINSGSPVTGNIATYAGSDSIYITGDTTKLEFAIKVTAQNGTDNATHTITIVRSKSTDATLAEISFNKPDGTSTGNVISSFVADGNNFKYDATAYKYANDVTDLGITVTPTKNVDPLDKATYSISQSSLNGSSGNKTVTVTVTAPDGTTKKTYSIIVYVKNKVTTASVSYKDAEDSSKSGSLSLTGTDYKATVAYATKKVNITATPTDSNATVKFYSGAGKTGELSTTNTYNDWSLNVETVANVSNNTIYMVVFAEDTTIEKEYTINIIREESKDSTAAFVGGIASGSLSDISTSTVINVENDCNSYYYNVKTIAGGAKAYVGPTEITAVQEYTPIAVGDSSFTIRVKSAYDILHGTSSNSTDYEFEIHKKSNDSTLSKLEVKSGSTSITDAITSSTLVGSSTEDGITTYNYEAKINVNYSYSTVTLVGTKNYNLATISANNVSVTPEFGNYNQSGVVTVVSEDGKSISNYKVFVQRLKNSVTNATFSAYYAYYNSTNASVNSTAETLTMTLSSGVYQSNEYTVNTEAYKVFVKVVLKDDTQIGDVTGWTLEQKVSDTEYLYSFAPTSGTTTQQISMWLKPQDDGGDVEYVINYKKSPSTNTKLNTFGFKTSAGEAGNNFQTTDDTFKSSANFVANQTTNTNFTITNVKEINEFYVFATAVNGDAVVDAYWFNGSSTNVNVGTWNSIALSYGVSGKITLLGSDGYLTDNNKTISICIKVSLPSVSGSTPTYYYAQMSKKNMDADFNKVTITLDGTNEVLPLSAFVENEAGNMVAEVTKKLPNTEKSGSITFDAGNYDSTGLFSAQGDLTGTQTGATLSFDNASVGKNTIVLTVTSEDYVADVRGEINEYYIIFEREPNENCSLDSLKITPYDSESQEVTDYIKNESGTTYDIVVKDLSKVKLDATINAASTGATVAIYVGDKETAPTYESGDMLPYSGNKTTYIVVVTAGDNESFTDYIVNAYIAQDLSLASASTDAGVSVDLDTLSCETAVGVTSATLTAVATNSNATVSYPSGQSVTFTKPEDKNVKVKVTSNFTNLDYKEYTIKVTRPADTEARLQALSINTGTLSPEFDMDTFAYAVTVPHRTKQVTLSWTAKSANVKSVTCNGDTNGTETLAFGDNTIKVIVTAEDGSSTEEYIVTVTREREYIESITINGMQIPGFNKETQTGYVVEVTNNVQDVNVDGTVSKTGSSLSGDVGTISLSGLSTTIQLTIKDSTGTLLSDYDCKYLVTINKVLPAPTEQNPYVNDLDVVGKVDGDDVNFSFEGVNGNPLSFDSTFTGPYYVTVPYETASVSVLFTDNRPTIMSRSSQYGLFINGTAYENFTDIPLVAGETTEFVISTVNTAQEDVQYYLYVSRLSETGSAEGYEGEIGYLTDMKVFAFDGASVTNGQYVEYAVYGDSPAYTKTVVQFEPEKTYGYTVVVDSNNVQTVRIDSTLSAGATATYNGANSNIIVLNEIGENEEYSYTQVVVLVTKDTKSYTYYIDIYAGPDGQVPGVNCDSDNNNLSNLGIQGSTLTPVFSAGTTGYSTTIFDNQDYVILNATAVSPDAEIAIQDISGVVDNGDGTYKIPMSSLTATGTIVVKVTSALGNDKDYEIDYRLVTPDNDITLSTLDLSVDLFSNTLAYYDASVEDSNNMIFFSPNTITYYAFVGADVENVQVKATPTKTTSTVECLVGSKVSGQAYYQVPFDTTKDQLDIYVKVTAEDGTEQIYTVYVLRNGETTAEIKPSIKDIYINDGTNNYTTTYNKNLSEELTNVDDTYYGIYYMLVDNEIDTITAGANLQDEAIALGYTVRTDKTSYALATPTSTATSTLVKYFVEDSNGDLVKTYYLNVYRNVAGNPDPVPGVNTGAMPTANLTNIKVNEAKTPVVTTTPGVFTGYSFTVPMTTENITLNWNYETDGAIAQAVVDGNTYVKGSTIPVELGDNSMRILVSYTLDGLSLSKEYTINVHRTTAAEMVQNVDITMTSDANNLNVQDHVKQGSTFKLAVSLNGTNVLFNQFEIKIDYDTAKVEYKGFEATYTSVTVTAQDGYVVINYYNASNQTIAAIQELVKLEFQALEEVTGVASFTVNSDSYIKILEKNPVDNTNIYHNISSLPKDITVDAKSDDATLSNLVATGYPFQDNDGNTVTFDPATLEYTVYVPNTQENIELIPTVNNEFASFEIVGSDDNKTVTLNNPSGYYEDRELGKTEISITVTAEDGTEKTYKVTVYKDYNDDATLKNVTINGTDLVEVARQVMGQETFEFSSTQTTYNITIPFAFGNSGMTFVGVPTEATSYATTNIPGQTSSILVMDLGDTSVVNIVVTAQTGTTKDYTFNLTKEACAIDDAKLIELGVVGYVAGIEKTVNQLFDLQGNPTTITDEVFDYQIFIPHSFKDVNGDNRYNVYGVASATNVATIKITDPNGVNLNNYGGAIQTSHGVSQEGNLTSIVYTFLVTAKDGVTTETYTLKVTRQVISKDASIKDVEVVDAQDETIVYPWTDVDGNEIELDFNEDMYIHVPYSVTDVTTIVTTNDIAARALVSGGDNLAVGNNDVTIMVLAESGALKYYRFKVVRTDISSNTNLADINVTGGYKVTDKNGTEAKDVLSNPDTANTKEFYVSVPYDVTTIDPICTVAAPTSNVFVTAPAGELEVEKESLYLIKVVSEAGNYDFYKLYVTREAANDNTELLDILVDNVSIGTIDQSGNYYHTLSSDATSAIVTATLVSPSSKFENGTTTFMQAVITPDARSYTVLIKVIAQNGDNQTHVLTLEKPKGLGSDSTLSSLGVESEYTLYNASGAIIDFDPLVQEYFIKLDTADSIIVFNPTPTDENAKLSGSSIMGTIPQGQSKEFTWRVTAEDGNSQTVYKVTVSRETASSDAKLSSLTVGTLALNPTFMPNVTNYTIEVAEMPVSVFVTAVTNDPNAKVIYGNNAQTLGVGSSAVLKVIVMAQDNVTMATYTVNIVTTVSSDSSLKSITFSDGSVVQLIPNVTNYTVDMNEKAMKTTVQAIATDSTTKIIGNGVTYELEDGSNTIYITSVAEDGSVTVYTFTVNADAGIPLWVWALVGMGILDVLLILGIIILALKRRSNEHDVEEE